MRLPRRESPAARPASAGPPAYDSWLAARRALSLDELQETGSTRLPAGDVPAGAAATTADALLTTRARPASRAEYLLVLERHLRRGGRADRPVGDFPATPSGVWVAYADFPVIGDEALSLGGSTVLMSATLLVPSSVQVPAGAAALLLDVDPVQPAEGPLPIFGDLGLWHVGRLREGPATYERACAVVDEGDARAGHPSARTVPEDSAADPADGTHHNPDAGTAAAVSAADRAALRWGFSPGTAVLHSGSPPEPPVRATPPMHLREV